MNTRHREGTAARDADESLVQLSSSNAPAIRFVIANFRAVTFGSKSAEFTIQIGGVGDIEADLFEPDGREAFVVARSTRSKFSGGWERHVRFEPAFASNVLAAVLAHRDEGARR